LNKFNEFSIIINQYDIELPISIEARYVLTAYRTFHKYSCQKKLRNYNNRTINIKELSKFITKNFKISRKSVSNYVQEFINSGLVRELKSKDFYILSKQEILDQFYPEKTNFFWVEWISEKTSLFTLKNFKDLIVRFEAGLPQSKFVQKRDIENGQNKTINFTTQKLISEKLNISEMNVSNALKRLQKVYGYQEIDEAEYERLLFQNRSQEKFTPIYKFTGTKLYDENGEEYTQVKFMKYIGMSLKTSLRYKSFVVGVSKNIKNKTHHTVNKLVNSKEYENTLKANEVKEYVVSYVKEEIIPSLSTVSNRLSSSQQTNGIFQIASTSFHLSYLKLEIHTRRKMLAQALNTITVLKFIETPNLFRKLSYYKNKIDSRVKILRDKVKNNTLEDLDRVNTSNILRTYEMYSTRLLSLENIIKYKRYSKGYRFYNDRSLSLDKVTRRYNNQRELTPRERIMLMIKDSFQSMNIEMKSSANNILHGSEYKYISA